MVAKELVMPIKVSEMSRGGTISAKVAARVPKQRDYVT